MDYHYTDFVITQVGTDLTIDDAIKLDKMENRVSRIVFKVEDWLKENTRLYVAVQNPETKRYHYEPLLEDSDGTYYMIVGTAITYYPGKTKLLLVGVSPSFELDDNITLSPEATIYVSKEFPRIVVLDNFLSDDAMELTYPNLDYMLDNLVVLHDNVVTISLQTSQDLIDCNEALAKCDADLERCEEILAECTELTATCEADKEACDALLEQNTQISNTVSELLTQARNAYDQCVSARDTCSTAATNTSNALNECRSILAQCQQRATEIQSLQTAMATQYNNHIASMRQLYEEIIESIRNEGGNP